MCWPWSHKWTKWKTVAQGQIERTGERNGELVGIAKIQERECETCGQLQSRTVKAWAA